MRLQFASMQKDTPFEWIADWLANAARLGVGRVLLYDNGSARRDALFERHLQRHVEAACA